MNSETKVVGLIGIFTVIIIVGGLWLAGKNETASTETGTKIDPSILVRADSPRLIGKNATASSTKKVQIVEFGDIECPACAALNPEFKKLLASNGDDIDYVFRFIPIHANSKQAAAAALAAGEQGKFFTLFDLMFERQDEWTAYGADINKLFDKYAEQVGLDMNKFHADLAANKDKYYALVDRDAADATATGIESTPTLIFSGKTVLKGAAAYDKLRSLFDAALAESGTATTTGAIASSTSATTANAR